MVRSAAVLVLAVMLTAGAAQAQQSDRHEARREWLSRRRAGQAVDSAAAASSTAAPVSPRATTSPVVPDANTPHRFADRYRPNYEAPARTPDLWPLQPLGFGAFPRQRGGYGRRWFDGYGCAQVSVRLTPQQRYSLYLLLPPAMPYDEAELELLLERELASGRPLQLLSAEGASVQLRPGARIERLAVTSCPQ